MNKVPAFDSLIKEGALPLDFHCHGIGKYDFTDIKSIGLCEINKILEERKQRSILTLYLPKSSFSDFFDFMDLYYEGKINGIYSHIEGIGLEGPLLASHGGTPEKGVWAPSELQWRQLARCGKKGLIYIILSPDIFLTGSNFYNNQELPDIRWITETLLEQGVLPAPGHFVKSNPESSAKELESIFNIVADWGHCPIITDHLYNDMPHNFKHAWRTSNERKNRDKEISDLSLNQWTLNNMRDCLGIIPATIIKNARKGLVKICQNFDGEHVDLAIVKKTVELVGEENLLMMTDSIESRCLAGGSLHMRKDSTLLYQDNNVVAAGTQNTRQQIHNMLSMGLTPGQIIQIVQETPDILLQQRNVFLNIGEIKNAKANSF